MPPRQRITRVHINGHTLRSNTKHGTREPVIAVRQGKTVTYAHEAIVYDADGREAARIVYSPDKPLSCGARLWVESMNPVEAVVHEQVCVECGNDLATLGHPYCTDCLEEIEGT